ncbi:MAG: [protein-PII] uridylyltransferase [Gammaproteobacteria bacterium]|nr:[protein-PII] uridylyltransferase [Gammaproteobacteria bacterium]
MSKVPVTGESGPQTLTGLRQAVSRLDAEQRSAFAAGTPVQELVRSRALAVDELLICAWRRCGLHQWPYLALVAVGGYGRFELHPASDIDVLILAGEAPAERSEEAPIPEEQVGEFITFLWDMRLEIGHSVRTVRECSERAASDITIATNLLEARLITGSARSLAAMREATHSSKVWPSRDFFEAKWDEQRTRHHRYDDTAYNLEPNIKEGPGGLRDLQMIGWVAKRHFGDCTLAELVGQGFLARHEFEQLLACQYFLWRLRFALHLTAGRREDRLLFDHQRALAKVLGFGEEAGNAPIEALMQQYYRTIRTLRALNEMLLELFQEVIVMAGRPARVKPLSKRFQIHNDYLEVTGPDIFSRYPFALLEMFLVLQQHPEVKGVRATTIRLVQENLHRIDDDFRGDLRTRSLFLEIMRQPRGLTHELQRMHDYGVLPAYLPAFGAVVGKMQYDLFHVYTVDQHTLFVVRNLRCFFVAERFHEFPRCSALVTRLPKPELLYLGGLFHDIAKGREGDHSELGAADAHAFCLHHGLSHFDADLVAWLVRNHLLMSVTAQRKDISDPDVVQAFARQIGDRMHLDYLYLLTVADIRATDPKLWNNWKDSLLWDLYQATVRVLRRGDRADSADLVKEHQQTARKLLGKSVSVTRLRALWRPLGTDYFLRATADEIAWNASSILQAGIEELPLVTVRRGRGGVELFLYTPDHNQLFAACTLTLDRLGLTVLDARIITAANGMTLDTFVVQNARHGETIEDERLAEIRSRVRGALRRTARDIPVASRMPPRQLRHFHLATTITFEHEPAKGRTKMEVITTDHPGLLARIGWALAACDVSLQGAKIATFGARAEDFFYLYDGTNGPLNEAQMACLNKCIHRALEPRDGASSR